MLSLKFYVTITHELIAYISLFSCSRQASWYSDCSHARPGSRKPCSAYFFQISCRTVHFQIKLCLTKKIEIVTAQSLVSHSPAAKGYQIFMYLHMHDLENIDSRFGRTPCPVEYALVVRKHSEGLESMFRVCSHVTFPMVSMCRQHPKT